MSKKRYRGKTFEERRQEINKLTDDFNERLESYFISEDTIKEHLKVMSNFHNYSIRNMILIDKQFRGAQAVGSFKFWKDKGVSVKKGEKGIKILVPAPVRYFERDGKMTQVKYANKEEKEKIRKGEIKTEQKMFFRIGHVFEYTQTNARDKGLKISEIFNAYHRDGKNENTQNMMKSLQVLADRMGVTILDEPYQELGTAKGVSYPTLKEVALNPRNTEYENIPVLIHELAHAKLHTPEKRDKLTTAEREFQAEMVSYVVASRYGIDTEEFSLSYLNGWVKNKELKDKEKLLHEVKETATEFIEIIDENLLELEKNRSVHKEKRYVNEKGEAVEKVPITEIEKILEKHNIDNIPIKKAEEHLERNASSDYEKYLTYKTLDMHKATLDNKNIKEPLLILHDENKLRPELKPFGEANNIATDTNRDITRYTAIIPKEEEYTIVSSFYKTKGYAHPLHHIEKENVVNLSDYKLLEKNFHDYLIKEENKSIGSIASKLKDEMIKNKNDGKIKKEDELEMSL